MVAMFKIIDFKYIIYIFFSCFILVNCSNTSEVNPTPSYLTTSMTIPFPEQINNLRQSNQHMTNEFFRNPGLFIMKTHSAYAKQATGKGIIIAVIDSYIDKDHPDLSDALHSQSIDLTHNNIPLSKMTNTGSHGTNVAGIIAARKNNIGMHGIAYQSKILAIRADIPNTCKTVCSYNWKTIAKGIHYAVDHGAKIINLSLGSGRTTNKSVSKAMQYAIDKGVIFTVAAGNNQKSDPIAPASFAKHSKAKGQVIAVGALNREGTQRVQYSNKAGEIQNFYLLAPGEAIYTTSLNGNYDLVKGTSMASPHVAGALALLLEYFPNIHPSTAVKILLESADDIGQKGPDNENGWGIINLERALQPSSPLIISYPDQNKVLTAEALFNPTFGAFGDWFLHYQGNIIAIDKYKRAFILNARELYPNRFLNQIGKARFSDFFKQEFSIFRSSETQTLQKRNLRLHIEQKPVHITGFTSYERQKRKEDAFNLEYKSGNLAFNLSYNMPDIPFSEPSEITGFIDQYLDKKSLKASTKWQVGSFDFISSIYKGKQDYAYRFMIRKHYKNHIFALEAGMLGEQGNLLNYSAFQARNSDKSKTYFSSLYWQSRYKNLTLKAYGSWLFPHLNSSQFITVKNQPRASKWGILLAYPFKLAHLSFGVSQPLKTETGSAYFMLPSHINQAHKLYYSPHFLALTPSGRELNFDLKLRFPINHKIEAQFLYRFIKNPYHIKQAHAQNLFWIGFKYTPFY